jgi:hypothetical protein
MPQITVTLDEDTFVDLIHYCAKGAKSRFVNRAVREAITFCTDFHSGIISGNAMHAYGRGDLSAARDWVMNERERRAEHQESLKKWSGEEE